MRNIIFELQKKSKYKINSYTKIIKRFITSKQKLIIRLESTLLVRSCQYRYLCEKGRRMVGCYCVKQYIICKVLSLSKRKRDRKRKEKKILLCASSIQTFLGTHTTHTKHTWVKQQPNTNTLHWSIWANTHLLTNINAQIWAKQKQGNCT